MFLLLLFHGFLQSDPLHRSLAQLVSIPACFTNIGFLPTKKPARFETLKAFKIINPTLILSFSLALAAVCLSCVPLGWFSKTFLCCWASRKQFSGNRYGSLISGCYVCLYWYLVLRKELSLVDYNQWYWVFGELINQERSCKLMDRISQHNLD